MGKPNVTMSIEPAEGDKLLYLAVAPLQAGKPARGMLMFALTATYTAADATGATLKEIRVSFPGSALGEKKFARDIMFAGPKQKKTLWLTQEEAIEIPATAPATVRVQLLFGGFDPVEKDWPLLRHKSPTPEGSYLFPGRAADLAEDEYFEPNARHVGGGSVQFYYDIHCLGWNNTEKVFRSHKTGTDGSQNDHHLIWGKPIHAVAAGTVIHAEWRFQDNPAPQESRLMRSADYLGGELEEVSIANLSPQSGADVTRLRMLAAVRTVGDLKVIVFEQSDDAFELIRLGDAKGPPCQKVAVVGLSATRAVTATQSAAAITLTLWDISSDGTTVKALDSVVVAGPEMVQVAKLTASRVVTATRTATGPLTLTVWELTGTGIKDTPLATKGALGSPQLFELIALDPARLVTPLRAHDGTLKVIVWDVQDTTSGTVNIARRGDASLAGAISVLSATSTSVPDQFATAVRNAAGNLEISYWNVAKDGSVSKIDSIDGDAVSMVGICLFKKSSLATAVRTAAGKLQLDVWNLDAATNKIVHKAVQGAGPVDRLAVANIPSQSDTAAALVRTGGHLKLILWRLAGQNGLKILHGNELVGYFHMQHDSLPAEVRMPGSRVLSGQLLGKAGNSGASSGPHLHLSATRVDSALTPAELIDQRANGKLVEVLRPLPFHGAQAMGSTGLKRGGVTKNPFSVLDDQGVYFDKYVIWPDSKS